LPGRRAKRNLYPRDEPVRLPVMQRQFAAMRQHDRMPWMERPRPKPAASSMLRALSPRTKGSSMVPLWASDMPGPSSSTSMVALPDDSVRRILAFGAESDRVLHEVGDAAMQVVGTRRDHGMIGTGIGDIVPMSANWLVTSCNVLAMSISVMGSSLRSFAQEGKHRFPASISSVEIGKRASAMGNVLDELGAQAHPRDRRAQVVTDRGQHPGAVIDQAAYPLPHAVERARHEADFFGARSGSGAGGAVQLKLSAALANEDSGAVKRGRPTGRARRR